MIMVTLRAAEISDLTFVTACAEGAYSLYVDRIGRKPAPMVADFAEALKQGHLEVLQVDDRPVGFLVSYRHENALFVENVAVDPQHQGQGLGSAIFALLEERAKSSGLAMIELYTNEKMTENLIFYPRLGFQEFDRRTESGFNRVYFRKTLD